MMEHPDSFFMEYPSSITITRRAALPVLNLVYGDGREKALSLLERLPRT